MDSPASGTSTTLTITRIATRARRQRGSRFGVSAVSVLAVIPRPSPSVIHTCEGADMQDFPLELMSHHPDWVIGVRPLPGCVRSRAPRASHHGRRVRCTMFADMSRRDAEDEPLPSAPHRAVSSGGEHFLDAEGARGSNPLPPTTNLLLRLPRLPAALLVRHEVRARRTCAAGGELTSSTHS